MSKLTIKNDLKTELSIEHTPGSGAKLLGSQDFKYIRDTIKDISDITPNDGDIVLVKGYHEINDGGGGLFVYSSNEPKSNHNGGTIIDSSKTFPGDWTNQTELTDWFTGSNATNGCWKRIFESSVNIKWFGTKEQDVGSTKVIQKVLDLYTNVYIPKGIYYIYPSLNVTNIATKIVGDGNQQSILMKYIDTNNNIDYDNILNIKASFCEIFGIGFNGGKDIFGYGRLGTSNNGLVRIVNNVKYSKFKSIIFYGIKTTLGSAAVSGLYIEGVNALDTFVEDCTFSNIINTTDNSTQGFSEGIFIEGLDVTNTYVLSNIVVTNSVFKDIYTLGVANASYNDGDAIRFFFTSSEAIETLQHKASHITNCYFEHIGASAVKASSTNNINISNIIIKGTDLPYDMKAGVRLWGYNNSFINSTLFEGNMDEIVQISGSAKVDNIKCTSYLTTGGIVFTSHMPEVKNTIINNIYIENLDYTLVFDVSSKSRSNITISNIKVNNFNKHNDNLSYALININNVNHVDINNIDVEDTSATMYYGIYLDAVATRVRIRNCKIKTESPNLQSLIYVGSVTYTDNYKVEVLDNYFKCGGNTSSTIKEFIFNQGSELIFKNNELHLSSKDNAGTSDNSYIYARGSYQTIADNIAYINAASSYAYNLIYSRDAADGTRVIVTGNTMRIASGVTTDKFAHFYNENNIDVINNNADVDTLISLDTADYVTTLNNAFNNGGSSGNNATNKVDINNNGKA